MPGKKLSGKATPKVFVATEPAELIVLDEKISYLKVQGASMPLWVNNTDADLFRMGLDGDLLPRGRALVQGAEPRRPWTFATPSLPEDFKRIRSNTRVHACWLQCPARRRRLEAVLLASIPRTARVSRKELKAPEVIYQGDPMFKAIEGSKGVEQAVNTDKDIVTR